MRENIFIRLRKNVEFHKLQEVRLHHIAYISATTSMQRQLESIPIYRMTKKDKNIVVIDQYLIADFLQESFPNHTFEFLGPAQSIIRITTQKKLPSYIFAVVVWLIIFIGTAMTIINFHYDVSMQEVHQKIHFLFTGEHTEFPLWIQIPYSIGLGVGMLLFFNHWFNRRLNEEPSPLEVEIYHYQQAINQYVADNENLIKRKEKLDKNR
ncbi:stage V sporulation protein AA [Virgibacillus soli]|uniref:stage V sporulation protein AA n=1 Tax=Paracerasibacillus soli TaxID=480284 RepID=UPI0035E65502